VREVPNHEVSLDGGTGLEENPFETPGNLSHLHPQRRLGSLLSRPLILGSSAARRVRRRGRHLSPCAYRSRSDADFPFEALRHEISINGEPHARSLCGSEGDSDYLRRLFENPYIGHTPKDIAYFWETSKISGLNTLLHEFDATTNEILHNVKAANERFCIHAKVLWER
jgi:hypothetical protein